MTSSARYYKITRHWRVGRAVECGGLENRFSEQLTGVRIPNSPPTKPRLSGLFSTNKEAKKNLKEATETLDGSFGFGNGILYDMCSNSTTDLGNPDHLSDMIWLIGRAYTASPERRTYGYERDENGKLKKNDNKRLRLWKATNANDGKGGYFISIARDIVKSSKFKYLLKIVSTVKGSTFSYDNSDIDIAALSNGIYAVYLYNNLIRNASEEFDGLNASNNPEASVAKVAGARCKNQISFCSKFLHFCCPNIVFIIDQYSLEGGKKLFRFESFPPIQNSKSLQKYSFLSSL